MERPSSDFTDLGQRLLLFALGVFVLAASLFLFAEPEGWTHLYRGYVVLEEGIGAAPGPDWFHDLVLALVHRGNGTAGLVVLRAVGLLLYAIMAYGFLLARGLSPAWGAVVLTGALLILWPWLTVGPVLSGVLLVGGLAFLLVRRPGRGVWWVLPVLFLVWANTAGSTLASGLVLAGAWTLGRAVTAARRERTEDANEAGAGRLALATALALGASLLNPRGVAVLTASFESSVPWRGHPALILGPVACLVLFSVLLVVGGRFAYLPHLLGLCVLALGSMLQGELWFASFAAAAPFLMAPALADRGRLRRSSATLTHVTSVALVAGAAWLLLDPLGGPGLRRETWPYPNEGVRWILEEAERAPVGAAEPYRGYVAFHLARNGFEVVDEAAEADLWLGADAPPGPTWRHPAEAPPSVWTSERREP